MGYLWGTEHLSKADVSGLSKLKADYSGAPKRPYISPSNSCRKRQPIRQIGIEIELRHFHHDNNFKYVSKTRRYMLGILAGDAFMDVDAQYIELPANKTLGAKKFNTSSSAWEGIFSAFTPQQVRAVSDLIVKDVVPTSTAQAK